jgi:biotin carboxylase
MPLDEETLFGIWDEAPDWLVLVHPAVDLGLYDRYRNKHLMTSLMASKGVLIPETHQLEHGTAEEILPIIDKLILPVVIKGAHGSAGNQVNIAETIDDAVQAVSDLYSRTGTYPALQEYVEGSTYQTGGLFDRGRPIHLLAAKKTQLLPARTGPAIALKSCNEPELVDAAVAVFSVLGHSGLAGADFVRDTNGRFYFLEVNPRVWGCYGFAKTIGINLFGAWYRQLCGEQLPTSTSFPNNRAWAKMPDYLYLPPRTRRSILRRALHPLAIRSWSWREPRVLMHQLRRAYWAFSGADKLTQPD